MPHEQPPDPRAAAAPTPMAAVLARLARSPFRARQRLGRADLAYLRARAACELRAHAERFVRERLAPAVPPNDGRQTPFRGHPVFVAQHGTATCCRTCLAKWHGIPTGAALTAEQQRYVVDVILAWLEARRGGAAAELPGGPGPSLFEQG